MAQRSWWTMQYPRWFRAVSLGVAAVLLATLASWTVGGSSAYEATHVAMLVLVVLYAASLVAMNVSLWRASRAQGADASDR
ncbi:hypothetical protein [Demequina gelatinilytica]|uniref:hypothetical protein n=1 Tax=Demequina gelatinilytica TaxID=1638980 RepID=UPI0007852AD1|nr:hypothetical protein [Demequina gelatinilytica]